MRVTPLETTVVDGMQRSLLLILGSVGIVLLIACSNVANLLLARSFRRRKEFTLRSALGAGRSRLIRQVLTESLMLAASGGFLSILLAVAAVGLVKAYGPADIPRLHEVSLDWRVLLFAIAASLVTGILFGLAPAIGAARENVVESLKEGDARSGGGPTHPRLRNALLVSQVTLALVLVISAGLLMRTFYYLLQADPGFRPARVLTFDMSLSPQKYPDLDHIETLYTQVLNKLRAVPGAESVGITETLPMGGEGESTVIKIVDHPTPSGPTQPFANYTVVSSEYFSAVGATILQGRAIDEADTGTSLSVCVVNEAFAKMYWPREEAIGKQVALGSPRYPVSTVVGLVADIKHFSKSEEAIPEMYVPYTQKPWPSLLTMHVAMRTRQDPASVIASAREAVHSVDADLPVAKAATLMALLDDSMTKPRFSMLLLSGFAALALLLASVGMYAVISYGVAQRTREIGIRIALGAKRSDVFAMVILQGARLAAVGIVAGLLIALGVTQLMTSFLYGVRPTDPVTYLAVSALLVGVALLACWIPARRAMRVDPIVALRHE
jgi:putative ABC transport system permease protein